MSQSFKNVKKIFEIKEVRLLMKSPKQKRLVKVNLMKMIIRGAQAPTLEQKPINPTSSTMVGTMIGSKQANA